MWAIEKNTAELNSNSVSWAGVTANKSPLAQAQSTGAEWPSLRTKVVDLQQASGGR